MKNDVAKYVMLDLSTNKGPETTIYRVIVVTKHILVEVRKCQHGFAYRDYQEQGNVSMKLELSWKD